MMNTVQTSRSWEHIDPPTGVEKGQPFAAIGIDIGSTTAKIVVYCDGKLVFTSNVMKDGSMSQYFEIDITGVDLLTIQYAATNGSNDMAVIFNGRLS